MNKIAVFCSASDAIEPVFMEKARELGAWLGQHRKWLVYGGSNTGLMEALAKSAKENGAMIMEGIMEISYGKNTYLLEEGDSIYYDSIVPHHVHAYEGQAAKILAVVYTPI